VRSSGITAATCNVEGAQVGPFSRLEVGQWEPTSTNLVVASLRLGPLPARASGAAVLLSDLR
jgi:hypothetical protein